MEDQEKNHKQEMGRHLQFKEEMGPQTLTKTNNLPQKIFKGMSTKMVYFEKSLLDSKRNRKKSFSPLKKIETTNRAEKSMID